MLYTGAGIVLKVLKDLDVECIFGYPGGAILPIYDEIFKQNKIRHILVRHEQGAVHMAEGYARSTGKVGVAKFDVYAGDDQGIKTNKIVNGELINGLYQSIGVGLQIRFAGLNDDSTSTQNDEWEVEVTGIYEEVENASMRSVKATRKDFKQFYRGKNGSRIY